MEVLKQIIEDILKVMGFGPAVIEIKKDNSLKDKELSVVDIKIDKAEELLKENAEGLRALQHLVRILMSKKDFEQRFILLDINNYKKEREKFLTKLAEDTIKKVRKTKKAVTLEPMSAYERRFIHMKLAEQTDLVTQSTGQEPERSIVVRLYP